MGFGSGLGKAGAVATQVHRAASGTCTEMDQATWHSGVWRVGGRWGEERGG